MRLLALLLDYLFPPSPLTKFTPAELMESLPRAVEVEKDTIVLFEYAHKTAKDLVWEVKYKGNKEVAKTLGILLYDALTAELEERHLVETPLITRIPSSAKRRVEKGFNQAELLAQALVVCNPERFEYAPTTLSKVRHTESQLAAESRSERLKNLEGSMEATPAVQNRLVVVVDDVTTTGGTFREAKRALCKAGARKVICLALAH